MALKRLGLPIPSMSPMTEKPPLLPTVNSPSIASAHGGSLPAETLLYSSLCPHSFKTCAWDMEGLVTKWWADHSVSGFDTWLPASLRLDLPSRSKVCPIPSR